jgi:peptidoglycan/xylan/chitin deacetylase (PgdA/CDA1 family)
MTARRRIRQRLLEAWHLAQRAGVLPTPTGVPVLCYHSVDTRDARLSISPRAFGDQLRAMRDAGWEFITSAAFVRRVNQPHSRVRQVLLTFDDGYANLLTSALPALREYGATAVTFVHTDRSSAALGTDEPLLDWSQIARMREDGLELGNHSHSHCRLESDEHARAELDTSEALFRQHCGFVPDVFAYPGGYPTDAAMRQLRARSYGAAFTTGLVRRAPENSTFTVPRITVDRDMSVAELMLMLEGAGDFIERVRTLGRRPTAS